MTQCDKSSRVTEQLLDRQSGPYAQYRHWISATATPAYAYRLALYVFFGAKTQLGMRSRASRIRLSQRSRDLFCYPKYNRLFSGIIRVTCPVALTFSNKCLCYRGLGADLLDHGSESNKTAACKSSNKSLSLSIVFLLPLLVSEWYISLNSISLPAISP